MLSSTKLTIDYFNSASSGQFLDLVSNLDLSHGGHVSIKHSHMSSSGRIPYSLKEETIGPNIESGDSSDSGSAAYASPASTVSPGRRRPPLPAAKADRSLPTLAGFGGPPARRRG